MQKECQKAYNQYMYYIIILYNAYTGCRLFDTLFLYDRYHNGRKKKFFQHVKSLRRDPRGIPTLEKDGITYSADISKANVLNEHYFLLSFH